MQKLKKLNTRDFVRVCLLLTLTIILSRFLQIETPFSRLSLAFLPLSICGILYGSVITATVAGLADILAFLLGLLNGNFNLGITLVSVLNGAIYGFLLYNKEKSYLKIVIVSLLLLITGLFINTYFISIVRAEPYAVTFMKRIPSSIFQFAIRIPVIGLAYDYIIRRISNMS